MYSFLKEFIVKTDGLYADGFFNALRKKEFARLDQSGQLYVDYTGGNLYPQCLADQHYRHLQTAVYGNPHSNNPASQLSGDHVAAARSEVLRYFNATGYECIFTANASGALHIVGECYPFDAASNLLLTADNHNSVNGIREYCKARGGSYSYCGMNKADLTIDESDLSNQLHKHENNKNKLFCFPAQSNASGVRHSLSWIKAAQEKGWDVLLDAAAFVPGAKLDLSEVSPDFVAISFYKIFGYPTGLGCLLVKKAKFEKLQKRCFAGGTVSLVSVVCGKHFLAEGFERFENGTVNYLDLPAVTNGLRFINSIGIENISKRLTALTGYLLQQLLHLKHGNGRPLIKVYGPQTTENRGGNILMNFFDSNGRQHPFECIEEAANKSLISLRTGCFCNPGIDEIISGIEAAQLMNYFKSRTTAAADDMMRFFGKPRGAVRVSVGIATTVADIIRFIGFAEGLTSPPAPLQRSWSGEQPTHSPRISTIISKPEYR